MFVISHGKKIEEWEQWAREEEEWTMRCKVQGGGGGLQNRGKDGMAIAMGNLVLSIVGSGGGGRGYVCRKLP